MYKLIRERNNKWETSKIKAFTHKNQSLEKNPDLLNKYRHIINVS